MSKHLFIINCVFSFLFFNSFIGKSNSCPEKTYYNADEKDCSPCPESCLKCIDDKGEHCVQEPGVDMIDFINDYWVLLLFIILIVIALIVSSIYLYKLMFTHTVIREGGDSVSVEMKMHFTENPLSTADRYTYIVDYVNA